MHKLMPVFMLAALALPTTAEAYIGPGASAGTIAVVFGIFASIVLAFFAVLFYPLKRMIKKHRSAKPDAEAS